jgi:hypothetical protein
MNEPTITGVISEGTLRNSDLIPAFARVLATLDPNHPSGPEFVVQIEKIARTAAWDSEEADFLLADLQDGIAEAMPEGWHFGTHEGDGACFGIFQD